MKLKKVLAAALAGTMVMASLTAVSAETIEDQSISTFLQNINEGTIEGVSATGDFDITFTFHNDGNRSKEDYNWLNFVIEMRDEDGNCIDVRADNYGWVYVASEAVSYNSIDNTDYISAGEGENVPADDEGWATWLAAMSAANGGSDCTVNITRSGNVVTISSTCGGSTFVLTTADLSFFTDTFTIYLSGEQVKLTNIEYTINGASSSSDDTSSDTTEASDDTSSDAAADDSSSDDTSSTTTTDTTSTTDTASTTTSDTTTQTGDAAPIAAVAVALIGCAAIAFASKKRFA